MSYPSGSSIKGEESRRLSFLQMTAMEVTAVVILRLLQADLGASGLDVVSAGFWGFSVADGPLHGWPDDPPSTSSIFFDRSFLLNCLTNNPGLCPIRNKGLF